MHNRARILEALTAAVATVETISSVTTGVATLGTSVRGVAADVSLAGEKSERINGELPNVGVLQRVLKVAVTLECQVPLQMSATEFEDTVIAPVEIAIVTCEPLAALADDWFVSETHYEYAQDGKTDTITAVVLIDINYSTPPAEPGRAL